MEANFTKESNSEIVLPYAAGDVLGYSRSQMDILLDHEVIGHLVKREGCNHYYLRSELLVFCEEIRTDPDLAACIDYLLGNDPQT